VASYVAYKVNPAQATEMFNAYIYEFKDLFFLNGGEKGVINHNLYNVHEYAEPTPREDFPAYRRNHASSLGQSPVCVSVPLDLETLKEWEDESKLPFGVPRIEKFALQMFIGLAIALGFMTYNIVVKQDLAAAKLNYDAMSYAADTAMQATANIAATAASEAA
jgi:hypothetical protein